MSRYSLEKVIEIDTEFLKVKHYKVLFFTK